MRWFAVVILAILPSLASSQTVISRAMVDGRTVTLLDDGTWRFADRDDTGCDLIVQRVEFCGLADGWRNIPPQTAEITAAYRFDDRHYGQMIVEELGTVDGLTLHFMRDIVIENAAAAAAVRPSDVVVIDVFESRVSEIPVETIVYHVAINGLPVVFANAIYTSKNRTMQLITFSIGSQFTDMHRSLHDDFLAAIEIEA
ncbi:MULTISPECIES: hypothetical protein [unclassified Yoonia]|uniref:hypothetical protein n=1 Tax=unclassified Yoonia TaxID=2629118 RepID=UPI002AFF19E2|nr:MULTISPECIES: hypothetical protein [unclassified Yoonia]